ncbi:MAG: hypothetical protein RIC06_04080 [Cyclobacteriaceae bacterium]
MDLNANHKERIEAIKNLTRKYARLHNISLHHSGEVDFDIAYRDLESEMKKYNITYEELDQELLRASGEKSKSNIIRIEKYKGELNGVYQTLWIAISKTGNVYSSEDLQLKQEGPKVINDIESTKWKSISNEHYTRIMDEMHCVHTENYVKSQSKPKHQIKEKSRNQGLGF